MKKIIGLIAVGVLLSAGSCKTTDSASELARPVAMPDLPKELDKEYQRLPDLKDPSLGGIIVDSSEASAKYNDVAFNNNRLVQFYKCVQKSKNERKEIDKCLAGIE
jgi:hypothetical protein